MERAAALVGLALGRLDDTALDALRADFERRVAGAEALVAFDAGVKQLPAESIEPPPARLDTSGPVASPDTVARLAERCGGPDLPLRVPRVSPT